MAKRKGFLQEALGSIQAAGNPKPKPKPRKRRPSQAARSFAGASTRPAPSRASQGLGTRAQVTSRTSSAPPKRKTAQQVRQETAARNRGGKPKPTPKGKGQSPDESLRGAAASIEAYARRGNIPKAAEKAKDTARREAALRFYTEQTQATRKRMVREATARAKDGSDNEADRLVLDAHYRRGLQTRTKDEKARARQANRRHDAEVLARQIPEELDKAVQKLIRNRFKIDDGGGSALGTAAKIAAGVAAAPIASGVAGTAAATALAGKGISKGLDLVGPVLDQAARNQGGAGLPDSMRTAGGLGDASAAGILRTPVAAASVIAENPQKEVPRLLSDAGSSALNLPAAVAQAVADPAGTLKATGQDLGRRYSGDYKETRKRIKKEGALPEVLDVAGAASLVSPTVTQAAGALARGTGNRLDRFVNEPRPNLRVSEGKVREQRKSRGAAGLAVQRAVDARRRRATQAEVSARARRLAGDYDSELDLKNRGRGQTGPRIQNDNEVIMASPRLRDRAMSKELSRIEGTYRRRLERYFSTMSRPAAKKMRSMTRLEQAAVMDAIEAGWDLSSPDAAKIALSDVETRLASIRKAREGRETRGAGGDRDELKVLGDLREALRKNPEKVLTPRLRKFVEEQRQVLDRVAGYAGDELRPSTMKRRAFMPLAQRVGTHSRADGERIAFEALDEARGDLATAHQIIAASRESLPADARRERGLHGIADRTLENLEEQMGPKLTAAERRSAEAAYVDTHAERTLALARERGLGAEIPRYLAHYRNPEEGLAAFAAGSGAHGPVSGSKRSQGTAMREGIRSRSPEAVERSMATNLKRSAQWRYTDEVVDRFAARDRDGAPIRFTSKAQLDDWLEANGLDPSQYRLWRGKTADDPPDGSAPSGAVEAARTVDSPDVSWKDGQFAIPARVASDMERRAGAAQRGISRFTGLQSALILGSMPHYGIRQVVQNGTMAAVAVGGRGIDMQTWRNLKAIRALKRDSPDAYAEMLDMLGVRSSAVDAANTGIRTGMDMARETQVLQGGAQGLYGLSRRALRSLVAERRRPGASGAALQAAGTAVKVIDTASTMRAIRAINRKMDAVSDEWYRMVVLAANEAKRARRDATTPGFKGKVRSQLRRGDRAVSPLMHSLGLPEKDLLRLQRSPEYRKLIDDAGTELVEWMGDYANYTKTEQALLRSVVPFYGFARHSARLAFNVLPLKHPFSFAVLMSQSNLDLRRKWAIFSEWLEDEHNIDTGKLSPRLVAGYRLLLDGGGDLEVVDLKWLNPLTGPLFSAIAEGPQSTAQSTMTPALKGFVEAYLSENNLFTKAPLSNEAGQIGSDNPLTQADRAAVVLNRVMNSIWPFRAAEAWMNADTGKKTDVSLPAIRSRPYPYTAGGEGEKRNQRRIEEAKDTGRGEALLDSAVPFRGKSAFSLVNQASAQAEAKKAKPKKRESRGMSLGGGIR